MRKGTSRPRPDKMADMSARRPNPSRRLPRWLPALFAMSACTWQSDSRVFLTTDPPGADVAIDGIETGQTTPVILDLDAVVPGGHTVTVRKNGFGDQTRTVLHHKALYGSRWEDGAATEAIKAMPLFWTFGDAFAPFAVRWQYEPHELHVKLYKNGEWVTPDTRPVRPTDVERRK